MDSGCYRGVVLLRAIGDMSIPRRHRLLVKANEIGRTGFALHSRDGAVTLEDILTEGDRAAYRLPYAAPSEPCSKGLLQPGNA
jgi:hypothetical protein